MSTNPEPVLITGGAGLLGAAVVRQLLEEGQEKPIVLDINPEPTRLNGLMDQIEYIQGDLSDREATRSLLETTRPAKIYHFAAFLGDQCEQDPMRAVEVNVNGLMTLLEGARQYGIRQIIFSSSLGAYGMDLDADAVLGDKTLQRPLSFYGVTKLFGEGAGRFYRRKYGVDYRGIHYPAIVGPGIRAAGIVTYMSAMIEKPARGEPYTIEIEPDTRVPIVYVEDGARAAILLGRAPAENIKTVNYFINGLTPVPSAGEMVQAVKRRFPEAQIDFKPNPAWQAILKLSARPVDDASAREEWGWQPLYDTWDKVIESYLTAL